MLKKNSIKTKDISFLNIFLKKFVVGLIITLPMMLAGYFVSQRFLKEWQQTKINAELSELALDLAEIENVGLANDKAALLINARLSEYQEELQLNSFVTDSSLSFYNLTEQKLVAKSFEIPILCDEEAINWWKKEADVEIGVPTISLSDEMIEFCREHKDEEIMIESMTYLNSVLCPSKIMTLDSNGNKKESCSAKLTVTAEAKEYAKQTKIALVGNSSVDSIYQDMTNYRFTVTENKSSSDGAIVDMSEKETKEVSIVYMENTWNEDTILENKTFAMNETDYQLDCVYQLNFWNGAWGTVLLIEGLCVLLCALIALLTTREAYRIFS